MNCVTNSPHSARVPRTEVATGFRRARGLGLWAAIFLSGGLPGLAALHFDGIDDVCRAPSTGSLDVTQAITISLWVSRDQISSGTNTEPILCKGNASEAGLVNYGLRFNPARTNAVEFYYTGGVGQFHVCAGPAVFNDSGTWHHLAFVFQFRDPASALWYVDGRRDQGSWGVGMGTRPPRTTADPLKLGRDGAGVMFHGQLDEVAIWNQSLRPDQIRNLSSSRRYLPLEVSERRPVVFWTLDNVPGGGIASGTNSIVDLSGHGNHATPFNGPEIRGSPTLSYP